MAPSVFFTCRRLVQKYINRQVKSNRGRIKTFSLAVNFELENGGS
jgi:hypothetical protein